MTSLVGWSLVVTRVHCVQTVHPRPIVTMEHLIGNPTPGIQWYNFRPPGVTPNRGMGPPVRRFLSNYFDLLLFFGMNACLETFVPFTLSLLMLAPSHMPDIS